MDEEYAAAFYDAMDDSDVCLVKEAYKIDADKTLTIEQKIQKLLQLFLNRRLAEKGKKDSSSTKVDDRGTTNVLSKK